MVVCGCEWLCVDVSGCEWIVVSMCVIFLLIVRDICVYVGCILC